jgi:hypothetical protein
MNTIKSTLKNLILLSFLWGWANSIILAQNVDDANKWGWYANLDYSYMGRGTYDFFIISPTNEVQVQTRTEFRPSLDLGVTYNLNKKFFSSAGISYKDNGHDTRRLLIPDFKESFHVYRAFYLTPNIGLGFDTSTFIKNIDFNLANFWMYNIYLGERSTEPEFSSTDLFNWKNYISTAFSTDLSYRFNNKTSLGFGPRVEVNVSETTKQEEMGDSINNDFIRIGFQLTLKSGFN